MGLGVAERGLTGAKGRARGLLREAKGMFSSDWESAFLKATRPDDDPAKSKHVLALVALVDDFTVYSSPSYDPYRPMLHKVWSRLIEGDARTALKAAFILHSVSHQCSSENHQALVKALRQLSRERSKKSDSLYFAKSHVVVSDEAEATAPLVAFARHYWDFVSWRFSCFGKSYDELRALDGQTPVEQALATLKKAQGVLSRAMRCSLGAAHETDLTASCLELTLKDFREAWALFGEQLVVVARSLREGGKGKGLSTSAGSHRAVLQRLCQFHLDHADEARAFVLDGRVSLKRFSLRSSPKLEDGAPTGAIHDASEALAATELEPPSTPKAAPAKPDSRKRKRKKPPSCE